MIRKVRNISAAYTALIGDDIIQATMGSAYTITLPTVGLAKKKMVTIKDDGQAGTNNITVAGEASETIDGGASHTISTNYAAVNFFPNALRTAWLVS